MLRYFCAAAIFVGFCAAMVAQSTAPKPANTESSGTLQRAIAFVESGHCAEALPLLSRAIPALRDKQAKYQAGMAQARCAMALNQQNTAVEALLQLRRDFPNDPEVLYVTTHYFSELASRTSEELAHKAPQSFQARRLEAEAYESQGKWDQAAGIYKGILAENPQLPGIHYRLGQVLLSQAGENGSVDEAKEEFRRELQIDPRNASAEFVLGELGRRAGQWDDAAQHFARATTLDVSFSEAYLALGMSLAATGKFAEATGPLQAYVRAQPDDPAGHYQLAIVYARTNNREGAEREMALQKRLSAQHEGQFH